MKQKKGMSRRSMLKATGAATVGAGLAATGCAPLIGRPSIAFDNADFYSAAGEFDIEAGKDAYLALMRYHGYPITPNLRADLWVSDYGKGEFTSLGLACIQFINDQESGYLGQDLFLLPNQMLPEHYHIETPRGPAKMEGWHVRYGISYVYGEGEPTEPMHAVIPPTQRNHVSVRHETILHPGQCCKLNRRTAHHWQFGGPQGAIVSEYGTFHDNDGVRHADPTIVFP